MESTKSYLSTGKANVLLKINQQSSDSGFCGYVLSIDKNLIIVDANAHHIDIEKTVLDIDDTDVLTELQLGKLGRSNHC